MSGGDAGAQQDFMPAFERAAGYLEEILHVMQDNNSNISDTCDTGRTNQSITSSGIAVSEKALMSVGASNEFFLSQTGNTALSDVSSQDRNGVKAPTCLAHTATTMPTATEFNGLGDTMVANERIAALECALLHALRDEGLPDNTAQRVLHGTMSRTVTLQGRNEGKLDHELEHGDLSQCREAMRQQAGENKHLRSQLKTSQAQLREKEGELALFLQCGRESAELRLQLDDVLLQLRDRDAELAEGRNHAHSVALAAGAAAQPQHGVGAKAAAACFSSFPCTGDTAHSCHCSCASELGRLRADLQRCGGELAEARRKIEELSGTLRALELRGERDSEDYSHFIKQLTGQVLPKSISLGTAEILNLGTYGYAFICEDRGSEERVVVKAQSRRYLDEVVREWAQGNHVGVHPHIAACKQVALHRDSDRDIICCLEKGVADGRLVGRRPSLFPESYVCIVGEFMDQGTLQGLMDTQVTTPECMAAVIRQVSSALAFLHSRCHTHEDLGPSNVLLKRHSRGDDKLVVKLADTGLARRSAERQFDHSLLGSLVCCMGIDRPFHHYQGAEEQVSALTNFRAAAPMGQGMQLWSGLSDVISRLWRGDLNVAEVEGMEVLHGHEVRVPWTSARHLEQLAKDSLIRRCVASPSPRKPAQVLTLHPHNFTASVP